MAAYAALAKPALESAGGTFIARGMPAAVYELGISERVTLIEWDSVEQAIAAHDGAAYQEALAALGDGAERDIRIVKALVRLGGPARTPGAEYARGEHRRVARVVHAHAGHRARPAASARSRAARRGRPRPRSWTVSGTPITGRSVWAATTPGSAADRPAPAMITRSPRMRRVLGVVGDHLGVAVGRHHADLVQDAAVDFSSLAAFSIAGMSDLEPITMPTCGASTSRPSSSAATSVSVAGSLMRRCLGGRSCRRR